VPIFSEVKLREGPERTRSLLSHVASVLFWTLLLVSLLGIVAAPWFVTAIATGFRNSVSFDLATLLTRWMFPYILFMSLVACFGGVLNAFGRFGVPAFTPVLLNVSMIGLTLLIGRRLDPPVLVLALGVLLGGSLQLAIQVPALARIGMLPRLSGLRHALADAVVRRILRQMLPAVFAVSVAQLSLIINTNIASHLSTGSNSWLYYADRLMELPTALLGVAIGTVLLPTLSSAHAAGDTEHYGKLLDWGLRLTCLLALPAAIGLAILADGLIGAMFQGGRFSALDVAQSAAALRGYAVGLLGLIGIKILAPGFYARQDIRTPVRIGVLVLLGTQLANLAARALAGARRTGLVDRPGGLAQLRAAAARTAPAQHLSAGPGMAPVCLAPGLGPAGADAHAGLDRLALPVSAVPFRRSGRTHRLAGRRRRGRCRGLPVLAVADRVPAARFRAAYPLAARRPERRWRPGPVAYVGRLPAPFRLGQSATDLVRASLTSNLPGASILSFLTTPLSTSIEKRWQRVPSPPLFRSNSRPSARV
jgi:peptidoglycan biosynthesis protein MviN/MurJ (putative lipid II flippase)